MRYFYPDKTFREIIIWYVINFSNNFEVSNEFSLFVGKNIANPIAMINASINLLRHLGKNQHAQLITDAIHHTLSTSRVHTHDIGGSDTTTNIIAHIKSYIEENLHKYKSHF